MTPEEQNVAYPIMDSIALTLGRYVFRPATEHALQAQVADILTHDLATNNLTITREVATPGGRYDILVTIDTGRAPLNIVLELKLSASAPAVERQASRYAASTDVSAVMVVTTSQRLANELRRAGSDQLGDKPFVVFALRSF